MDYCTINEAWGKNNTESKNNTENNIITENNEITEKFTEFETSESYNINDLNFTEKLETTNTIDGNNKSYKKQIEKLKNKIKQLESNSNNINNNNINSNISFIESLFKNNKDTIILILLGICCYLFLSMILLK